MNIQGGCHCGNLRFALDWTPAPEEIVLRICSCSFCSKHGAAWTSHPAGTLRVWVRDPARMTPYSFATQTARFHICTECGALPFITCRIDEQWFAVVNANCFENVDSAIYRRVGMSFEGESTPDRLARRKKNWIGCVEFMSAEGKSA